MLHVLFLLKYETVIAAPHLRFVDFFFLLAQVNFCYYGGLRTSAISFELLAVIFLQINFFFGLFVKQLQEIKKPCLFALSLRRTRQLILRGS